MKKLSIIKISIRTVIISFLVVYFGCIALLNIPMIQHGISRVVSSELKELLQTEVKVGNIDLGLLNRVIIQDVYMNDREGNSLLKIARFSAKFDISALFKGQIRIQSVQLFGAVVHLKKDTPESDPNFRFIIDAFASDNPKKNKSKIDLRVNSLLIRRGELKYDVVSKPETPGKFNANHVQINNLSANISLKAMNTDSLNVQIRRMSFVEKSGFQLRKIALHATANKSACSLRELEISLPQGSILVDSLDAVYKNLFADKDSTGFQYTGNLLAQVVPADFSAFTPVLRHFSDTLTMKISFCNYGNMHNITDLQLYSPQKNVLLLANGHFIPPTDTTALQVQGVIRQAEVTQSGFEWLFRNLTGKAEIPVPLNRIGTGLLNAEVKGTPRELETKLMMNSALGTVMGQLSLHYDRAQSMRTLSGRVFSESLALGTLLGDNKKLGNTSFNLDFKGLGYRDKGLESYVKGLIYEFEYQGYKYHNIELDGDFKPGSFSGKIALDDENAQVALKGNFSTAEKIPVFDLYASVNNLNLEKLRISDKFSDTDFSGNLTAKFSGSNIDDIQGSVEIDSLLSVSSNKDYCYSLPHFLIKAQPYAGGKEISIRSPFLNGSVRGSYSYKSVICSIQELLDYYVPSFKILKTKRNTKANNKFLFNIEVDNTEILERVFRLPVHLGMPASLHGWFDDSDSRLYLNGNVPQLTVNGKLYESVNLLLENPNDALHCRVRGNLLMNKGSMINLSLNTHAKQDSLFTTLHWGNNTGVTYSGKVVASTSFSRGDDRRNLHTTIDFKPGHFILNDTIWNIHPSKVIIDKDSININNIHIEHADQYVRINGILGKQESDTCKVNLKGINLLYIMDMIQFDAVKFEGEASGTVCLGHLLKEPLVDASLDVKDFSLNGGLLGRAVIKGGFDNEQGRILLDADIHEDSTYSTRVDGFVSIKEKGLDLNIHAGGTRLEFLSPFVNGIFSDVSGRANGFVRLYGPFKKLDLEGDMKANLGLKVNALNNYFYAQSDSVHMSSGEFLFQNVHLTDKYGNKGMVDGFLKHNKFKNLTYQFRFNTHDMLIFHTTEEESEDYPFYGSIYATGSAVVQGNPQNGLMVDAALKAEDKTTFVYVLGAAAQATSDQFITFVDRTPKHAREEVETEVYHYLNKKTDSVTESAPIDMHLNLQIEPDPMADMRILMDPVAGDYISAKGTGNLRVHFFNKGDFQIFGNYNIAEGIYKISMQNVIRKDFTLRPGGSVSFNGNPRAANLNLQAVHTVPSASLNDLIPDATSSKGNVRVNCLVNLSGNLTSPNMTFDLELPTVSEEDRELVRSLTSTPEQMTTQIIYLLGVGKFYAFDYANQSSQSNATSALAFNTLSGQLNNMLSQVIDNQNWNLGTNLSTGQNGWTDVEAEAILSGRLLNNRLIINGNFGYRENTLQNSNFVGDFEAVWLLTENGDFRLRGYNMTNDRYFTKSTMTTQGVGFIYKKDFTRWSELFDWFSNFKAYRKRKMKDKKVKEEQQRAKAEEKRNGENNSN